MNKSFIDFKDVFQFDTDDPDYNSLRKQLKSKELNSDIAGFIEVLLGGSGSSSSGGGDGSDGDGVDDDEGLDDTHLKMFMESLTPDGNSYVLKRDGKPDLKFEGMDECCDGSCSFDDNVEDQEELSSDCESESRRWGKNLDVRSGGSGDRGILGADGMRISGNGKGKGKVETRAKNMGKKQSFMENEKDCSVDLTQVKRKGKNVKNVEKQKGFVENERGSSEKEVDLRPHGTRYSGNVKENGKVDRKLKTDNKVEKQKSFKENERNSSLKEVDWRLDGVRFSRNVKENGKVERKAKNFKNVEKQNSFMKNERNSSVQEADLQVKRKGKNVEKQKVFVENERDSSEEEVDLRQYGMRFSRNVKGNGNVESRAKNVKNVEKQKSYMGNERDDSFEEVDLRPDGKPFSRNVKGNGKVKCSAKNVEKIFMENERESSMEEFDLRSEQLGKVSRKRKSFDPDYKMLFDKCEGVLKGERLVILANGKRLILGEDDNKSLSDSEVYVLDHAPDCIESNYAPTSNSNAHLEEEDLQCLGSHRTTENPLFRKAVMDILRRPFDYDEYRRLRKVVKLRKPVERHVDTRSGNTSFEQATMGKSYLDHYADLKKQFDAFKNDVPKRLNILRGFIFYLERMADDGKFKPWLDDSCLAITPQ